MKAIVKNSLVNDPYFSRLKALVIETTGMAFYSDKDDDLARIIGERVAEIGITGCAAYLERLNDAAEGRAEMDALVAELTIGETYFFRHREQFDALRDQILPDVIKRNHSVRRIRIWSAGCSIGPEPYSIAILLKREFGAAIAGWNVSIIGTDINQKFLNRAREGRYDEWAFRALPEETRRECFVQVGKQWEIKPEFKAWTTFQYHNLTRNRFPSIIDNIAGFDVIVCRNVIIYFSAATIRALVPCFREALVDGGWLIMGHAEPNVELFREFQTVNAPGAVLYQRLDTPPPPAPPEPADIRAMCLPLASPKRPHSLERPGFRPRPLPSSSLGRPPETPSPAATVGTPFPDRNSSELAHVRSLADAGRWEEAAKACEGLIQANAMDARAHFLKALVVEQTGDAEEAEQSLRRAIYLDRHFVLPHYHLGLFLWGRNDPAAAARSFRNVLALLERFTEDHSFSDGDDITAGQLREIVGMHLRLIGAS